MPVKYWMYSTQCVVFVKEMGILSYVCVQCDVILKLGKDFSLDLYGK